MTNKQNSLCPEFWDWLPKAYRDGDIGDEPRFTKYNMEVAFLAGKQSAALEAKDEKQKPVNIKKVAEEHGINLPTEFVPKHDESKAAIQSLTDQCAALIWERDELQKQMWRSEKQEPVKAWCETCEGGGKVYQEHQAGCWVGGEHACPDCDGNGYYTTPPQRTWVGLTDEEIASVEYNNHPLNGIRSFARSIEAKLKERNK